MNFIEELRWRGMIHNIMPGTEEIIEKEMVTAYVGIDPTADSLHIGHLVSIMMLKHLQLAGHKPIALIGGATGMIGDPSGKSKERNLMNETELKNNEKKIKKQLLKFLDFNSEKPNNAELANNYDWMKDFSFLGFLRDIGKHLTLNYMIAKDSVKTRMETGISFTEFSYQLVQGYDFLYLFENKNCKLQMGGSDQWGNITSGTELIRRKIGENAYSLTCPLITKADGGKFGKTEEGNIWLNPDYTSPYKFYQFWLNVSDVDAEKYIKIFTLLSKKEIDSIIIKHHNEPHKRILQQKLAKEITIMVHSQKDYNNAINASQLLFGKSTLEDLQEIDEQTFLSAFDGIPQFEINKNNLKNKLNVIDLLAEKDQIFLSKGEARRFIKGGGLSINKEKVPDINSDFDSSNLLFHKYFLVQKGKKKYFLIIAK